MSLSGNLAMGLLRRIKPGKGSFSDLEKLRQRARRENEGFTLRMPRNRKAECVLLPDTTLPCMVVKPRHMADPDKAILYLYGGVTNHWNTQRNMAVRYAVDAGVNVWYPVYPSISEACVTEGLAYLAEIYRRMLAQYDAAKIVFSGIQKNAESLTKYLNNTPSFESVYGEIKFVRGANTNTKVSTTSTNRPAKAFPLTPANPLLPNAPVMSVTPPAPKIAANRHAPSSAPMHWPTT